MSDIDDAALPFDDDFTDDLAKELDEWRETADDLYAVLDECFNDKDMFIYKRTPLCLRW